jgi:hypothetical protein
MNRGGESGRVEALEKHRNRGGRTGARRSGGSSRGEKVGRNEKKKGMYLAPGVSHPRHW